MTYSNAFQVSVLGIISTVILSKVGVSNRSLVAIAATGLGISSGFLLGFCSGHSVNQIAFSIAGSFVVATLPMLNAASTGMYAKMYSESSLHTLIFQASSLIQLADSSLLVNLHWSLERSSDRC